MTMNIQRLDWFIVLPLLASLALIADVDAPHADVIAISPLIQAISVGVAALLVTLAVAAASAIDRHCSEEYMFQILASAALVAFAATMLINLIWIIGVEVIGLPALTGDNIIGVITFCWGVSYYWFRLRGVAQ